MPLREEHAVQPHASGGVAVGGGLRGDADQLVAGGGLGRLLVGVVPVDEIPGRPGGAGAGRAVEIKHALDLELAVGPARHIVCGHAEDRADQSAAARDDRVGRGQGQGLARLHVVLHFVPPSSKRRRHYAPAFFCIPRQSIALAPKSRRALISTPSTSNPWRVSMYTPSWPSRYAYSIVSIWSGEANRYQAVVLLASSRGSAIGIRARMYSGTTFADCAGARFAATSWNAVN